MDTKLFRDLYQANIDEIKAIEQLSIDHNMLDNGYYLAWKDNLNKLSIDLDRVKAKTKEIANRKIKMLKKLINGQ